VKKKKMAKKWGAEKCVASAGASPFFALDFIAYSSCSSPESVY
jgi:hypothetical protein